ncbi:MAG: preprotein translocase subunit SecY [Acidimicrobiaceae bacterium]|nr:preprotein translocase subunit SecY [Acidimicrobiaceae bacterium]MXW76709.1 preprotein translocase subunit SecY [Acidimicrobiaceae bacterium]MYA74377.1 preprotein translocase subunit SecY [Acidimicrobiaceae bacterium]MYC41884.1 preprotein translocase subunit SecY [Acidimicrobiaceae bacterium]MYD06672.1 preprotein translocase subunit SecY [Acidimicrobiaceae bacterium]
MLSRVLNVFRVADLRVKILFTLSMIALYRLGSFIPAPGVDIEAVQTLRDSANSGGILAYMQLFSGGALTQFAIFALGIMPYITSSIIMQILGVVIPKIEQWQQQGAVGQRKITQWTRYLTVSIAVVQSTSFAFLFHNGGLGVSVDLLPKFNAWTVFVVVLTLTSGTALLMWMGELITQRGVGNGMSLLIFTSVVSTLPAQGATVKAENGNAALVGLIVVAVGLLVCIVFVEQGQRRIPVQFAKRVVGRRMYGGQSTYIPLKVNQSGVIPIIFASSVLYVPNLIAVALPSSGFGGSVQRWVDNNLAQPTAITYLVFFGLLIVGFSYFYTAITFDPAKQADTIRKQGGFIPGIRPGPQTERYLARILSRITFPGALFIAAVALVPSIIIRFTLETDPTTTGAGAGAGGFAFGGISLLIASGVALETMKQIDSQLTMRNYEGFLQ